MVERDNLSANGPIDHTVDTLSLPSTFATYFCHLCRHSFHSPCLLVWLACPAEMVDPDTLWTTHHDEEHYVLMGTDVLTLLRVFHPDLAQ
eukprot:1229586-Amphidinium_carterae.2